MNRRTSLNPCVTAVDFGILRIVEVSSLSIHNSFIWRYLQAEEQPGPFTLFRRLNVKNPKRTWCAIIPRTLLIADLRVCPRQKLAAEPSREKRQSLLTLHARGYSVESNSQRYRCICIPSEEEDKLNQHLTSTKRLLDLGEQNESFLIWTTEVWGRLLSERYNLHGVLVCTTEQFMVNILFFWYISFSL